MAGFKTVEDVCELLRLAEKLRFSVGSPGGIDYQDDYSVELSLLFDDRITDDGYFSWQGSLTACLAFLKGVNTSYLIDEEEYSLSTQKRRQEVLDALREKRKQEELLKKQVQMVDTIKTGKVRGFKWL